MNLQYFTSFLNNLSLSDHKFSNPLDFDRLPMKSIKRSCSSIEYFIAYEIVVEQPNKITNERNFILNSKEVRLFLIIPRNWLLSTILQNIYKSVCFFYLSALFISDWQVITEDKIICKMNGMPFLFNNTDRWSPIYITVVQSIKDVYCFKWWV